jgi:hypothetical protein
MVDEILSALPPRERAEQYRDLARQAREQASLTKGDIQLFLMKQAGDWAQLAIEAEQEAKGEEL